MAGAVGGATVPFTVQFASGVVGGTYRAVFGNTMRIVEVHDSIVKTRVVSSTVTLKDSVTAFVPATATSTPAVFDVVTGVSTAPTGVPFAGSPTITTVTATSGDTVFYKFSAGALGFMVLNGSGVPMFVSTTLTGTGATPPALFGNVNYGGFVVSADNRNAGVFSAESTFVGGALIPQANVNSFYVQWRQESATKAAIGQGNYHIQWTGDPFGVQRGFTINFGDPTQTATALADSLAARTATLSLVDSGLASILAVDPATLRAARIPFTITNTFTGRPVRVVVFNRVSNTMVIGDGEDTVRVAVPASEWIPGDRMAFIEDLDEDSLGAGTTFVVLGADGRPLRVTRPRVTFTNAVIGCNQPREACNPVRPGTRGAGAAAATGYLPLSSTTITTFHYFVGFNRFSDYTFNLTAPLTGAGITTVSSGQLDSIRVVPNPFVAFSTFQTTVADSRVVFTHLPPRGSLRIYSVSGQFVQQINWTTADLTTNGDLFYNLRTREGTDLATGMYIWVLNTDVGGRQQKLGKFVVIRSRSN